MSGARNEHDQSTGPAYLCNAQGDPADGWLIDALGDKFAPLPTGALVGTAGVRMPDVALSGPQAYTVPSARVRFADKTRMPLAMPTKDTTADAHELPPGDYTLTVTNVNGKSGSAAAAIRVVPPPTIMGVSLARSAGGPASTSLCADQAMILGSADILLTELLTLLSPRQAEILAQIAVCRAPMTIADLAFTAVFYALKLV